MNAAITSGTLLDKRLLLQERPTQIVQTEDPKRAAMALARRLGVTLEATAHDVKPNTIEAPRTNELPLPSQSVAAKPARTRAKKPAAD